MWRESNKSIKQICTKTIETSLSVKGRFIIIVRDVNGVEYYYINTIMNPKIYIKNNLTLTTLKLQRRYSL